MTDPQPTIEPEPTADPETAREEDQILERCTRCMRLRGGSCDGVLILDDEHEPYREAA